MQQPDVGSYIPVGMLDGRTERSIAQLTDLIRAAFGRDLLAVILYGSAAGEDYVRDRSDLNIALVFEKIRFDHLQVLHEKMPGWSKFGLSTPLLLDRDFLGRARDVFPMELFEIKAQHRVLWGEDVITPLEVDARHLRFQAEQEIRQKLLRLRSVYVAVGLGGAELRSIILDSVESFVIIMRNFLRVEGAPAPPTYHAVIQEFETRFGIRFPKMQWLVGLRDGSSTWGPDEDDLLSPYLDEVEHLVGIIDRAKDGRIQREGSARQTVS